MRTPRLRLAPFLVVAALLLSGCEMTVRIGTEVDAAGRGAFTVGIELDRELLDGLRRAESDGLRTVEGLFGRLATQGWQTSRSETAEGLRLAAQRPFADAAGFQAALRELGSGPGDAGETGSAPFTLDHSSERSFLKTRNRFAGEIDTTGFFGELNEDNRALLESLSEEIARVVHFEVSAALPGSVSILEGDGTVTDGVAVWRPVFGTRTRFGATSSAFRMSSLLMIAVPLVLLVVGLGLWWATRRRELIVEEATLHRRRRSALPADHRVVDLTDGLPSNGAATNGAPVAAGNEREPEPTER